MELSIFTTIIILLITAVIVSLIFRLINLPSLLGYLLAGTLLGPHVLNWVGDTQDIRDIAEFGVVFLLFTIGLEFSLSKLIAMRRTVLGYGGLQVIISFTVTFFAALALGMTMQASIVVGTIVAMSSTAIVIKQLADQTELYLSHGTNAVGILLLQDLAVIPCLILIPSLAHTSDETFLIPFIWALVKSVGVIFIIIQLGRRVLRPVLHRIAAMQSSELFTFTALLVALSSAWLTHFLGLSLTLGAFFAGMMLGETEYRHQINIEIRPFRDVLLGLFFITIGMQFDFELLSTIWIWVFLLVTALVLFKILLIFTLGIIFKNDKVTALRTGLVLAQGGEFGFALLFLALNYELLPNDYGQVVLGAILISMLISPVIIRFNKQIADFLFPSTGKTRKDEVLSEAVEAAKGLSNHAIICGYGRVGQNIARLLEGEGLDFVALDLDVMRVQQAKIAGDNMTYGDASHAEMLKAVGINQAKALVICIDEKLSVIKILHQARQVNRNIPILVRSYDDRDLTLFQTEGATEVIPETLESSLILGSHLLLFMGVPAVKVFQGMEATRRSRYELFKHVFPGSSVTTSNEYDASKKILHAMVLPGHAFALGHPVAEINKHLQDVRIVAIQHEGIHIAKPDPNYILEQKDTVVLFGASDKLELAKSLLLSGEGF